MRTGLLVVGIALAVVGSGAVISLFDLPSAAASTNINRVAGERVTVTSGAAGFSPPIVFPSAVATAVSISWNSDRPIQQVDLYAGGPCSWNATHLCPQTNAPLGEWIASDAGSWSTSAPPSSAYFLFLELTSPPGTAERLRPVNATETASVVWGGTQTTVVTSPVGPLEWSTILMAGTALAGIGAVAAFLGLFLRAGVWARRGPEFDRALDAPWDEESNGPPLEPEELDGGDPGNRELDR